MRRILIGSLLAAALVGLGVWIGASRQDRTAYRLIPAAAAEGSASPRMAAGDLEHAFERVAEAVLPSVVSITTEKTIHMRNPHMPFPDPFGDEDFGGDFKQQSLGSGVIVNEDGTILTNNHVVADADQLSVHLADGRRFDAVVVGADPRTEVAVIRIEASGLTPARLGNSDEVNVGQWVMAVGSPFGLEQTVSAGIVSAKGRANVGVTDYEDFLQTDAAINPGNSGGPLVNLAGEVIGINTAIASDSGAYQGIGFAIPSNMASGIMERLVHDGQIVRGWLGVWIQPLTEEAASSLDYDGNVGVLVAGVQRRSPAAKAGIKKGDVLTALNHEAVGEVAAFRAKISGLAPGTQASLTVWRAGETRELTVTIGEMPQ